MENSAKEPGEVAVIVGENFKVAPGYPKYRDEAIWFNATTRCDGVSSTLWELKAGAHQPIRRWLKQRKNRPLTSDDFAHLGRVLRAASALCDSIRAIEEVIPDGASLEGWLT